MDIGTIVRTILLIVAWINQFLAIKHISPIPVDEVFISTVVTGIISIGRGGRITTLLTHLRKGNKNL